MKYCILCLSMVLLLLSCANKEEKEASAFELPNPITQEEICEWFLSDTAHGKILCFTSPFCIGCRYEFQNGLAEMLNNVDTSKWRQLYVIMQDCKDSSDFYWLNHDLQKLGVNMQYVRYSPSCYDSAYYAGITSRFNVPAQPFRLTHYGIPQMFLLDKHNNLYVRKTFFAPDTVNYVFSPVGLRNDDGALQIDDFSQPCLGWMVIAEPR